MTDTSFQVSGLRSFPAWEPPDDLNDHLCKPLPLGLLDFFVPPPAEIGKLLSAHSTLKKSNRPWSLPTRLIVLCFMPAALCLADSVCLVLIDLGLYSVLPALPMLVLVSLGLITSFSHFRHTCSYVGMKGVARYQCRGRRERLTLKEVFLFRNAVDLRAGTVRTWAPFKGRCTEYFFSWVAANGAEVYGLRGAYEGERSRLPASSTLVFGGMAEVAWSYYLLDAMQDELEEHGSIQFNLSGEDWIRVGHGFLEIRRSGHTLHLAAHDLDHVSIVGGFFKVRRTDAKVGWFGSSGVYTFGYESMANAKVFLLALEKLVGIRV